MAANPQIVNADIVITYDGVKVPLVRGQVIDMPAGGALANAPAFIYTGYNTLSSSGTLSSHVTAMSAQQATPVSSDSIAPPSLANATGGGGQPYAWGQN
jgi:hypothetical protein